MNGNRSSAATIAKQALDSFFSYRDEYGYSESICRAIAIGETAVENDSSRAIAEAITLICATYASHYQQSGNELRALAETQEELVGKVGFEVAGVQRPLNRETYEHPHGGFTGRSTLPRWLVELEGDNGEEKR